MVYILETFLQYFIENVLVQEEKNIRKAGEVCPGL